MQAFAIVVSLVLTVAAVVLLAGAVRSMLGVIRVGQAAPGRTGQPGRRTVTMLKETVLHTRMLQWTWVGVMHWFVFAAFLFLSTAVLSAYFQLFSPEFAWPIVGHWYPYEWFSEVIGALSTVGIVFLIVYRQRNHPRSLGRQSRFFGSTFWQAYFVEIMALLEGAAILFIRGAEYNLAHVTGHADEATRAHFPLASWFGDALYPSSAGSESTLHNIIYAIAVFKIALAMVWLIVIARNLTMGIAWHRFTAWFNIWFKREDSGRTALGAIKPLISAGKAVTLDDIDELDEDARLGVGAIEDFSWKGILDFTTCTECGRCQSQCPAWNTDKPLSPKLLIMGLREHAYEKAPYLRDPAAAEGDAAATAVLDRPLVGKVEDGEWFYNPPSGAAVIDEDVLWSCTSCGACVQQCPVDIEHVDHIMDMRRYQVLVESSFPSELSGLFKGLENKGNPWNMAPSARLDWAKDLPFEVKVVGEDIESLDEVDWLFWVGCAGAYEDRAKKTTRAVAELLDMAGVSFGVLGNGETCTGDPARRAGNEFVFQGLAQQNVETFSEYKVKKVVSSCAHCFNTLKNEYKEFGIELEVVHHTQLLNQLVRDGRLTPVTEGAGAHKRSITYHDPCYIGRHNGVYSPPRELLQILPGAELKEMPRNSERSFCCGAGGARMWMEERIGTRINRNRTDEAVATGADQIAVGCPFCRVMLSDGLTAAQADGTARESVEVLDVAQMLLASVKGEMATKLAPGTGTATASSAALAAEPSAGDVTVTPDTVTSTADAGPAAKASGGSSLFDTPAPDDASSLFDAPVDEAPAAAPEATSGGSLFDEGGSLFDTPPAAPAAPASPAAPAPPAAPASPAAPAEPAAAGGSLFDIPAEPAAQPEAKAEPAPGQPAAQAEPELGSSGSLFDVAPSAAEPAPAEPDAKASPEPQAAPAEPSVDLGAGGSLFDIPASAPAPAPAQEATSEPAEPQAPSAPASAAPEPRAEAAAAEPTIDLGAGGSLFDIPAAPSAPAAPAPASSSASAPATPAQQTESEVTTPAETAEPPAAEAAPAATPEPTPTPAESPSVEATQPPTAEAAPAATSEPTPTPESPSAETAESPAATAEPTPTPAAPASDAASTPRTDVDIEATSSLFDIEAPAGQVAAAAPAPVARTSGTATESSAAPADATGSESVPAEAVTGTAGSPADASEATTTAPDSPDSPATPEAATTAPEAPVPEADAEATDESGGETAAKEAAAQAPAERKPASSGEAHAPRTDADISTADSLFDL